MTLIDLTLYSFYALDRDLIRAQLHELKATSQRSAKTSLLTKGTFFSQFLKSERKYSTTETKLEKLFKLTTRKTLSPGSFFPTFESATEVLSISSLLLSSPLTFLPSFSSS